MVWLITGLLLALFGGLVVLTRWARRQPATDETLIEDLLGLPAGQAPLAPIEQEDAQPPPVPAAQPAGESDWLETQLTLITAWSERMQEQITSWAADADPPPVNPVPEAAAPVADVSRRADHEPREPSQPRPAPERCIATTAKGSQCKLRARPGDTRCTIHGQRAHS
jgi:hypothetical protein